MKRKGNPGNWYEGVGGNTPEFYRVFNAIVHFGLSSWFLNLSEEDSRTVGVEN